MTDRQLDALYAQHVMGKATEVFHGLLLYDDSEIVPLFTSDIAAAMAGVEKMRERGYELKLQTALGLQPSAAFRQGRSGDWTFSAISENVAKVIVLAALKALGVATE